jgi:hypothetical protein
MSVEASVFSPAAALTESELRAALSGRGTAIRLLGGDGHPLLLLPAGSLRGRFIVIGWPAADAKTTSAVDTAISERNKKAIDELGQSGKLGWCELGVGPFDYEEQWTRFPDEREEYEESVDPDDLAAIQACCTQYSLRSGLRPAQCAELMDQLSQALKATTNGVTD